MTSIQEWQHRIDALLASLNTVAVDSEVDAKNAIIFCTNLQKQLRLLKSQITTEKKSMRLQAQAQRINTGENPFLAMAAGKGSARRFEAMRHQDQRQREFTKATNYDQLLQRIDLEINSLDQVKLELRQKIQTHAFDSPPSVVMQANTLSSSTEESDSLSTNISNASLVTPSSPPSALPYPSSVSRESPYVTFPLWQMILIDLAFIGVLFNQVPKIGTVFFYTCAIAGIYCVVRDWRGVSHLRGLANPSSMSQNARIWFVLGYIFLWPIFMAIYGFRMTLQSVQTNQQAKITERTALKDNIQRLESELGLGSEIPKE